ncbi:Os03g0556900 [Oryza sativa Japonica Group]|uniref:Os03g0556900 protein n=2 Tax=Oryza sativa subsp. japonica TaxID=39947 RepID=Q0DQU3_ORYSJ|nr:hypothetical protein [Oryza sativa Japonica Group]ABF97054.1 hypothetical protein LOC_Os03g35640 [Oryza sativa Japonica Group]BAF12395.1 Os03g0556900 [Oryza sativa Japonica Group]|eukprot:NP_001050481.1 Os03g0556900 [Oryza sativa Japonica Group]
MAELDPGFTGGELVARLELRLLGAHRDARQGWGCLQIHSDGEAPWRHGTTPGMTSAARSIDGNSDDVAAAVRRARSKAPVCTAAFPSIGCTREDEIKRRNIRHGEESMERKRRGNDRGSSTIPAIVLFAAGDGETVEKGSEDALPRMDRHWNASILNVLTRLTSVDFTETRKGTLVQKYKIKVVGDDLETSSSKDGDGKQAPDGSAQLSNKSATDGSLGNQGDNYQGVHGVQGDGVHGVQGDGAQGLQGGNLNQNSDAAQDFFSNFQDRVDYVVHHALINQSGVLVNTLSNMMKSIADGSIAEHQAAGPVYLQGGVFPNYRSLITDVQPSTQAVPSVAPTSQPTALASTPLPVPSALAPGQPVNPQLLIREQPQHGGQVANRLTQDQVAATFLPPQPIVDPIQQQPIQQTPLRQQII